jgi:predicted oxidoreductase
MIYGLLRITNSGNPFELLDDVFYNKKINSFDTANCYGRSENIFGDWITSRGIQRNDIYVICKGGHHAGDGNNIHHRVNLHDILHDLNESLQRLKLTYADCFMFHRDDPNISPDQIYEISNHLIESGLCRKIGVSNWKTSRIEEVNNISNTKKGVSILEESQIFLNYITLPYVPYPNVHTIQYSDYMWYKKNPQHKIQVYSVACFIGELENYSIHQNKVMKQIIDYICGLTGENRQTVLYVLLSKCTGLNVECIHGSISSCHILNQSRIDEIYQIIESRIPGLTDFLPGFLVDHPTNNSFLMNGFVGPFFLENIQEDKIDSITNWLLQQQYTNYEQMKGHHEHNMDIKELCMNKTIHDIVTTYIGYECICYNTEFFVRQDNENFAYTSNWHIDPYLNIDDTYPHFTIQIGFTDNDDNNSLSAIAGSHLFDYQRKYNTINKSDKFAPLMNVDDQQLDPTIVHKLVNKKGYVYLFSNYLTHGRGIIMNNDTSNVRVALTMRVISSKSIIKTMDHWHISKSILTLGPSSTNNNECFNLVWNTVQNTYKSIF